MARRGDAVVAARSLGMGSVPAGTRGVVQRTNFLGTYVVRFDNGAFLGSVKSDDVKSASFAGPAGAGCSLACLGPMVVSAVVYLASRRRR